MLHIVWNDSAIQKVVLCWTSPPAIFLSALVNHALKMTLIFLTKLMKTRRKPSLQVRTMTAL